MSQLVLSCFPGIGLLDAGFERAGFCVVRGPDLIWGGAVQTFSAPAGIFEGVIGGPPCQAFSRLRHLVEANGLKTAPNLIPEFERIVGEAAPEWFLMEQVPQAPLPVVPGYIVRDVLINNREVPSDHDFLGPEQNRERRFSFGTRDGRALRVERCLFVNPRLEPTVCASGGARPVPVRIGGSGKEKRTFTDRHKATRKGAGAMGFKTQDYFREACRLQGLADDFLSNAPFTVAGKIKAVGNGVPRWLADAIARAIKAAIESRAVSA